MVDGGDVNTRAMNKIKYIPMARDASAFEPSGEVMVEDKEIELERVEFRSINEVT
jgi:hypothetical protein